MFLAEACPDDAGVRREAESLLRESESDDAFLASPMAVASVGMFTGVSPEAMLGRSVGGYLLETLLGAGGMDI